jgi:hypothetical protein
MELKLRMCNKCLHETIQVEQEVCEKNCQDILHGTLVWYCPNCGTNWKQIKKTEDIEVL